MQFTDTHEWVKKEGKIVTIGVTNHAQEELGEIVFVELPDVGQKVTSGDELAVLESTKAAADVYTPISGEVIDVNNSLDDNPELINNSAEENGWICKLELSDEEELKELLSQDDYQKLIT